MKCKDVNKWPVIDKKYDFKEIQIAVQINGRTRDVLTAKKDTDEITINKLILKNSKAKKHLENKKIIKTIFVKNRIINYIIKK